LIASNALTALRQQFGQTLQENVSMASYTTARVGGPADALLVAHSAAEIESAARLLWKLNVPFYVLGSGSNILIADRGLQGVVIHNRARTVKIDVRSTPISVWAESGANFGAIARQVALRGLSGLEWATAVPGTLGGAVYGNAGAFGGDMRGNLLLAEILHPTGKETWRLEQMGYGYRTSALKQAHAAGKQPTAIILSARLKLEQSDPPTVQARMNANSEHRRGSQPPGASMGSMFKNPDGDYAGRLIEAAGLKGLRIGDAEISSIHANFFINHGAATASDIGALIRKAQETVLERLGIQLALEVELLGDWSDVIDTVKEQSKGD
jgi:UDP-N-acetylmuramate dehydrogenase